VKTNPLTSFAKHREEMKVSIRKKIVISFFIFIIASTLIWFLNYYKHQLITLKIQIIEEKDRVFNKILEARRYEKNFFLFNDSKDLKQALLYIQDAHQRLTRIIDNYGNYSLERNPDNHLDMFRAYEQALESVIKLIETDNKIKKISPLQDPSLNKDKETIRKIGRQLTEEFEITLNAERKRINQLSLESGYYLYFALAAIFVLTFLTTLFIYFNVNRPLKTIERAIHKIASGDYAHIPKVSTGDAFDSLVTSLNEMIKELNHRNEQLIQTEKLASLGTLTSGVAHELNNPLNNISTSIQILLEELNEADPEFQRQLLSETEGQIDRAKEIVKALLEFSRSSSFTLRRVNFRALVIQTLQLLKGEIPSEVDLNVHIAESIEADLDIQRMQQVIINLVQNAMHSMKDGGSLRISAEESEDDNTFAFMISDTGKGIDPKDMAKIFDPFFTTKPVGEGSGLGLSITHGIIQQHHGKIEVQSHPNKGTTVKVVLPFNITPP
jgi:signal transduction histidine kinase